MRLGARDSKRPQRWEERLCGAAVAMDCGADLCVVRALSPFEQRLRVLDRYQRIDDLSGDDSPDGPTFGSRALTREWIGCGDF